jgi:hypothetical protein
MTSTCPKCQQKVTISSAVDQSAVVRCPLCDAEYELSEALALAPPQLIHVAGGAEEGAQSDSGGGNEAAAMVQQLPPMSATARLRSRKHKSVLHRLIEVLIGGVAGVLAAYYGLAIFYRADFHRLGLPQLPLPFISVLTAPPAPAGQGDDKGKKPATDEPAKPKPKSSSKGRSAAFQPVPMPLQARARCLCHPQPRLATGGETSYSSSITLSRGYAVASCYL